MVEEDDDGEGVGVEVEIDEEVLGGGVYSGQSVLVGSHCVIVTVAVIYSVLVVVCATADKALAARTTNDEACILKGASKTFTSVCSGIYRFPRLDSAR